MAFSRNHSRLSYCELDARSRVLHLNWLENVRLCEAVADLERNRRRTEANYDADRKRVVKHFEQLLAKVDQSRPSTAAAVEAARATVTRPKSSLSDCSARYVYANGRLYPSAPASGPSSPGKGKSKPRSGIASRNSSRWRIESTDETNCCRPAMTARTNAKNSDVTVNYGGGDLPPEVDEFSDKQHTHLQELDDGMPSVRPHGVTWFNSPSCRRGSIWSAAESDDSVFIRNPATSAAVNVSRDRLYYNKWQRESSSANETTRHSRESRNRTDGRRRPSNYLNLSSQQLQQQSGNDEDGGNNGSTSDGSKAPPVTPTPEFCHELPLL